MQEGGAIRPRGQLYQRRAAAGELLLARPARPALPGQKRRAGCHFLQATIALYRGETAFAWDVIQETEPDVP